MCRTSPILRGTFLTKQSTHSNSAHTIVTTLTRRGRSYIYMRTSVVVFIVQSVRSSSTRFGGSFTYFTVMNCQFFIDCRVLTFVTRNFCRSCHVKTKPTPSCPSCSKLCIQVVWTLFVHYFVHRRCRLPHTIVGICFIHHRRLEFFWF